MIFMKQSKFSNEVRVIDIINMCTMRSNADILMDFVHKSKKSTIVIDFYKIDSVSRSFAQQYVARKKLSAKNISERNINSSVKRMFVLANQKKIQRDRFDFSKWSVQQFPA